MCTNDNAFSHSSPLSSTVGNDVHPLFPHEINNGLSRPQISTLPHASGICLVSRLGSSQGAFFWGKFQLPVQNMHFYDCKNCLNGIIRFDVIRIVVPSDDDFHLISFSFFFGVTGLFTFYSPRVPSTGEGCSIIQCLSALDL